MRNENSAGAAATQLRAWLAKRTPDVMQPAKRTRVGTSNITVRVVPKPYTDLNRFAKGTVSLAAAEAAGYKRNPDEDRRHVRRGRSGC